MIKGPLKILLIEDNDEDYYIFLRAFEKTKESTQFYRFIEGESALEFLKENAVDLIFLDLNLPKKDGRQALVEIKTNPLTKRIPVIVITTSTADEDVFFCYDAGANSYVEKPIELEDFIKSAEQLIQYWSNIILPR